MSTLFFARVSNLQRGVILSLAQAVPEEVELTVGGILAILCVLGAFTGSLFVLATWRGRISRGEPIIPAAERPGITIPGPILVFGLLIALSMASTVIVAGIAAGSPALNANPDADIGDGNSADPEIEPATAQSPVNAPTFEDLEASLLQTAVLDVLLIVLLGVPIWWLHRERMMAAIEAETHDLDLNNPYSAPREQQEPQSIAFAEAEPWVLGREFRYATEAVLAAWLPTALLRLLTVLVSQDEAQHPFLEMISNGVSTQVLLLIAGTAVCLAPLMEELLYRVVILGGLLFRGNAMSTWTSALAVGFSSVLFSLAHGFPDSLALLPLAVIIGWTYHQRRSYRTVVLIHFLFNGFNIVIAGLGML